MPRKKKRIIIPSLLGFGDLPDRNGRAYSTEALRNAMLSQRTLPTDLLASIGHRDEISRLNNAFSVGYKTAKSLMIKPTVKKVKDEKSEKNEKLAKFKFLCGD